MTLELGTKAADRSLESAKVSACRRSRHHNIFPSALSGAAHPRAS